MDSQMNSVVSEYLLQSSEVMRELSESLHVKQLIVDVAVVCFKALQSGKKILFIGNGGSAADCQHMAGEYVSKFAFDRPGLPAIALTTDTSVLTAIGNDYGYEQLFSRQLRALGGSGDILFAYTTSGKSVNVLSAIRLAKEMGIKTVLMSGNSKDAQAISADFKIMVPSESTPHIQEGHVVLGHAICLLVESLYFGK